MNKKKMLAFVLVLAMVFQFCLFSSQGAWADGMTGEPAAAGAAENPDNQALPPGTSQETAEPAEQGGEDATELEEPSGSAPEEAQDEADGAADDPAPADAEAVTEQEEPAPAVQEESSGEEDAPLLGAPAADPVQKTIQIDIRDLEGNLLSNSDIPSAGIRLRYYEYPESAIPSSYSSEEEYLEYLEKLESYGKELMVTQQGAQYTLTMESDATPENPYMLVFRTGKKAETVPADIRRMTAFFGMPMQYEPYEWTGTFAMTYDGTTLTVQDSSMTVDDAGVYHGSLYYDDTMTQAKASLSFDTSEYTAPEGVEEYPDAYPVYVKAVYVGKSAFRTQTADGTRNSMMPYAQAVTKQVNADGTVDLTFPVKTSRLKTTYTQPYQDMELLAVALFSDETCTQQLSDWQMVSDYGNAYNKSGNDHQFAVGAATDGTLHLYDWQTRDITETPAAPVFKLTGKYVKAPLKVVTGTNDPDTDYPVYLKVDLTTDYGDTSLFSKTIKLEKDGETEIDLPWIDTETVTEAQLHYAIYADEECTTPSEVWNNEEYISVIFRDGKMYDTNMDEPVDTIELIHEYVNVPLSVDVYSSSPDKDYPAYIKVDVAKNGEETPFFTKVIKLEQNGATDVGLPAVNPDFVYGLRVSYAVYDDETCKTPSANWKDAKTVEGYLRDGMMYAYSQDGKDDTVYDTIALSHISTKTLTVPIDLQLGQWSQNDWDENEQTPGAFFPVTVEATLAPREGSELSFTPVTVTKTFASKDDLTSLYIDAAGDEMFEASTAQDYHITWRFFRDEEKTVQHDGWPSGEKDCSLTKNNMLSVGGDTFGIKVRPLVIHVAPQASPEELTVNEENPLYVWVMSYGQNSLHPRFAIAERKDLAAFDMKVPQLGLANDRVEAAERFTMRAWVTDAADNPNPAAGWQADPVTGGVTTYMTLDGKLQEAVTTSYEWIDSWGSRRTGYETRFVDRTLKPVYTRGSVAAAINVHVNVPEGVEDPYLWHKAVGTSTSSSVINQTDAVNVRIYEKTPDGYHNVLDHGNYSESQASFALSVADLDADNKGAISLSNLTPGTYYVTWFMARTQASSDEDKGWVRQDEPVKIIVQEDGTITDENGSPYTVEVRYKDEYKTLVNPVIEVNTHYDPENWRSESYTEEITRSSYSYDYDDGFPEAQKAKYTDAYNPASFTFSMKPLWENSAEEFSVRKTIPFFTWAASYFSRDTSGYHFRYWRLNTTPEGKSYIGDYKDYWHNLWWWGKEYYQTQYPDLYGSPAVKTDTIAYLGSSLYTLGGYSYSEHNQGINISRYGYNYGGYYVNEFYTGYPVGDYELSYYVNQYTDQWHQDTVKVHLSEDGKIYKINEDGSLESEPYVVELYMVDEEEQPSGKEFDELSVQVDTRLHDGIAADKAFAEGDTFMAGLYTHTNDGDATLGDDWKAVATGTATITDTGTVTLKMTAPDGGKVKIDEDEGYILFFGTYSDITTDEKGSLYPVWNTNWRHGSYYIGNYSNGMIADDGTVVRSVWDQEAGEATLEPLVIDNESLILPWETVSPQAVSQDSGDNAVTFKPITEYTQLQDSDHYMVVVQNRYNNKWYALAYDEKGGHQVELKDVNSLADLKSGYKISDASAQGNYVFTAGKVKQAEDSAQLQLKTGVKDENGKAISLKMGTSSSVLDPLFSNSAGTIIVRNKDASDEEAPTFQFWRGGYAALYYIDELFGQSGFSTLGASGDYFRNFKFMRGHQEYYPSEDDPGEYRMKQTYAVHYGPTGDLVDSTAAEAAGTGIYMGEKTYAEAHDVNFWSTLPYVYDVDESYLTGEYLQPFIQYYTSASIKYRSRTSHDSYAASPINLDFYILTDSQEESPSEDNNTYTLVKTFGDFYYTFVTDGGSSASMVLVYTDQDGKEYALNPKGNVQVRSTAGGSGYDKVITGAENELIPNNNSGTSQTFGFTQVDIAGDSEQVFAMDFAFRKSRQNNAENKEYLTLGGDGAWSKKDDAAHGDGLVYVMHPTERVRSQADWDTPTTYRLSVIRNGETAYLGVKDGQMVTVTSEDEAAEFKIYAPTLTRYYSSAYSSDFYKYAKINNLEEINAGDEILIVRDVNGEKTLVTWSTGEIMHSYWDGSTYLNGTYFPALKVLDEYSTLDSTNDEFPDNARYMYRLDTDEIIKKPYAYYDGANKEVIWAQGNVANAVGAAKKESSTQRKYDSVAALGNPRYYLNGKVDKYPLYNISKTEINFFAGSEDGTFAIRGAKSTAYLGDSDYNVYELDLATGRYTNSKLVPTFSMENTESPVNFEIYKRVAVDETFQVEYYDTKGELEKSETKPQDAFALMKDKDIEVEGKDYIFVGWTTDPDKGGLLGLDESANMFDYDDVAKLASVKPAVKEQYGLLGDCNPEGDNIIRYEEVSPFVTDGTLKLYPVYAVRGFSQPVTADEEDTMVVGILDSKDNQMGGSGIPEAKERWLGSVNIEVYKDGEPWVPVKTVGNTGRHSAALRARNDRPDAVATMYFAYHNDDAADLNIKFIEDGVTVDMLNEYLSNGEFNALEPTNKYVIDAVVAEQGGSEDGLRYRLNWMSPKYGGQLDNVKGGSTVKIYVTTKYQVKYYMDRDDGNGYQELTDDTWQNANFYTTKGTEDAIKVQQEAADYVVTDDNEYSKLIVQTPSDTTRFTDDAIVRGEYSTFLYKFDDYEHVIPIAALPAAPAGYKLDSDSWTIRDADLKETATVPPKSDYELTGTSYGTGNTGLSYKGTPLGDTTNTFHLYIAVIPNDGSVRITKEWDDQDDRYGKRPDAEAYAAYLHLMNGDEEVEGYTPEITEKNGVYTVKYAGMPATDEAGEEITYTIREDKVPGYEADGAGRDGSVTVENGGKIVNKIELCDLVIDKTFSTYESSEPVTCVFHVVATMPGEDGAAKTVYDDYVSITASDVGSATATISGLPAGADVTVTEVYAGAGYTAEGNTEWTTGEEGLQKNDKASFTNSYADQSLSGYGATNMYERGESGWSWKQLVEQAVIEAGGDAGSEEGGDGPSDPEPDSSGPGDSGGAAGGDSPGDTDKN